MTWETWTIQSVSEPRRAGTETVVTVHATASVTGEHRSVILARRPFGALVACCLGVPEITQEDAEHERELLVGLRVKARIEKGQSPRFVSEKGVECRLAPDEVEGS